MTQQAAERPVVFTTHARLRMAERGATEAAVREAVQRGEREHTQRGLVQYRLNLEFRGEWGGKYFAVQQIVPVVAEEADRTVVVTVYTFYFHEGQER